MTRYKLNRLHSLNRGAALVTSLVILLVLTVLGISAMKNSSTQENIVGNLRDHDLAFQSAEAALTAAEKNGLDAFSVIQLDPNSASGHSVLAIPKPTDTTWYDLSPSAYDTSVWSSATTAATLADTAQNPSYVIQKAQYVPYSSDPDDLAHQRGLTYYRITSRGVGTTKHSAILLQEIYGKIQN